MAQHLLLIHYIIYTIHFPRVYLQNCKLVESTFRYIYDSIHYIDINVLRIKCLSNNHNVQMKYLYSYLHVKPFSVHFSINLLLRFPYLYFHSLLSKYICVLPAKIRSKHRVLISMYVLCSMLCVSK